MMTDPALTELYDLARRRLMHGVTGLVSAVAASTARFQGQLAPAVVGERQRLATRGIQAWWGAVACWLRLLSDRMTPAGPPSSYRAIESLIATYAELVDDGDFAAVGVLLADATFMGAAGSVNGREAIEQMLRDNVIVYDDGTPRTKHVTTNLAIEVDEEAGTAVSRSYFTALQALPDMALQPIVSGRYHDRFVRRDGQWRFVERHVLTDLVGDVSRHLRHAAADR
jgi:3-phenylpropionate/cinnamic acid dioxygenase small subunit